MSIGLIEIATLTVGATVFGGGFTACILGAPKRRNRKGPKAYRRSRLAEQYATGPDPFADEPTDEQPIVVDPAPVNRSRFGYRADAASRVPDREPAEVLRDGRDIFAAERADLTAYGDAIAPSAVYSGHHESPAMPPEMQKILDDARWGLLDGGELTAALIAERVGAPAGQYPMVRTQPGDPVGPSDPPGPPTPKALVRFAPERPGRDRVLAAALMHRAAARPTGADTRPGGDTRPETDPGTARPKPKAAAA